MDRYLNTLKPMHDQFIEPMKMHADVIVENHENTSINLDKLISKIKSLMS